MLQPRYLWDAKQNKRIVQGAKDGQKRQAMEAYKHDSVELVYRNIMRRCRPDSTPATFTCRSFMQSVKPVPLGTPAVGALLGESLGLGALVETGDD